MTIFSTITHTLRAICRITWRIARITFRVAYRLALLIVFLLVLGNGEVRDVSLQARVTAIARPDLFDYVSWEVHALWGKAGQQLFGVEPYLPDQTQHDQVIGYLQRLNDLQDVEAEIEQLYTDPSVSDPAAAMPWPPINRWSRVSSRRRYLPCWSTRVSTRWGRCCRPSRCTSPNSR
jgi:hypothetical protein